MNEQIIEDPRASEIGQAFKDGDSVQFALPECDWVLVEEKDLFELVRVGKIRIVKKPKIVLSAHGFDFTAKELPLKNLEKGDIFFFMGDDGTMYTSSFNEQAFYEQFRLKNKQAFASKEAAEKWHAMTQAMYDDILRGVKHGL